MRSPSRVLLRALRQGGEVMSARRIRELGFPRVAALVEADNVSAAWRELRAFKPCSFGEAIAKDRAIAAMPEYWHTDEEDE
jgi:hypothetical protein